MSLVSSRWKPKVQFKYSGVRDPSLGSKYVMVDPPDVPNTDVSVVPNIPRFVPPAGAAGAATEPVHPQGTPSAELPVQAELSQ
jgi:hypothetical protein